MEKGEIKPKSKSHTKKEEILKVSLELFYERGYANTSINDIMKKANISKGGIYWYFQSKDEIYVAMMEEWYDEVWLSMVRKELSKEPTVLDKLVKYGYLTCESVDIPLLAILPESYLGPLGENYHDRLYALYKIDDDLLRELFKEAVSNEEIKNHDVDALVWVYASMLDGMFTQLLFKGRKDGLLVGYFRKGINFFIDGLR